MMVGQYEAVSDGYGRMLLGAIAKIVNRPVTQTDVDNFTDWVESSSDRLEAALMGGHSTREQLAREYFAGQLAERESGVIGQSCSFGENHRYAKLKTEQVREIRKLYRPGSRYVGGPALAVRFGVSSPTISRIITYKSWRFA